MSVPLPVLTPKVIGVAIARYDFSSRDTRELSLQEGDVVKIYTKAGANGWWRGEVNGRVGLPFSVSKKKKLLLSLLLLQGELSLSEVLVLKKQTRKLFLIYVFIYLV